MNSLPLISGAMLGLAGSLHCAAMCGGVACGALLLLGGGSNAERLRLLAMLQAGRLLSYASIGAALAWLGVTITSLTSQAGFLTMRTAGTASIVWMAIAATGWSPRFALLQHGAGRISDYAFRGAAAVRSAHPMLNAITLGLAWGLNACPMMFAAAFSASLSGNVADGATFMAGFALGSTPALIAACCSFELLKQTKLGRQERYITPLILLAAALATACATLPANSVFCART